MPKDNSKTSAVDRELRKARQALDDATKARDAGLSDAAVINRLYYAVFHSVQAAPCDRGFEPTSRGGVRSLFGSEITAAGNAPRRDGRFFSQLSELRHQADCGYDDLDANVDALHSRTQQFVSGMEALRTPSD